MKEKPAAHSINAFDTFYNVQQLCISLHNFSMYSYWNLSFPQVHQFIAEKWNWIIVWVKEVINWTWVSHTWKNWIQLVIIRSLENIKDFLSAFHYFWFWVSETLNLSLCLFWQTDGKIVGVLHCFECNSLSHKIYRLHCTKIWLFKFNFGLLLKVKSFFPRFVYALQWCAICALFLLKCSK